MINIQELNIIFDTNKQAVNFYEFLLSIGWEAWDEEETFITNVGNSVSLDIRDNTNNDCFIPDWYVDILDQTENSDNSIYYVHFLQMNQRHWDIINNVTNRPEKLGLNYIHWYENGNMSLGKMVLFHIMKFKKYYRKLLHILKN